MLNFGKAVVQGVGRSNRWENEPWKKHRKRCAMCRTIVGFVFVLILVFALIGSCGFVDGSIAQDTAYYLED